MNKNIAGVGEVEIPSTSKEKIQNFWYHYKWHSVVALVLVFAILICSLQLCTRSKYDAYILYAGSKNIGRTTTDGDIAEIAKVISTLEKLTEDFDENGEKRVSFTNYYFLTPEEYKSNPDANDGLLATDQKTLSNVLDHSEYYLVFISVGVYEQYKTVSDSERFIDLSGFATYNQDVEFYAPNAIKLSSLDAYKLEGLSILPEDTLICIRHPDVMASKSKDHLKHLENAQKILTSILKINLPE